jgi:hypothetical protein
MQLRGKLLAAALPAAFVTAALVQAPASAAATHWGVLFESGHHIKAEACRTPVYTSNGHQTRAVKWRGDARSASIGGAVQFHNSGGIGAWASDWVSVSKGKVSKVTTTYFLASEAATIQMRVKTANGTSKWGAGKAITSLTLC